MYNIYDYDITHLEELLISLGQKKFRATQIFEWVYRHGVKDFELMSNLGNDNIVFFQNNFLIKGLEIEKKQESSDGTRKYLFRLEDGNYVETVLMKQEYGYSVCVSSQVGCNMGCAFCASGQVKKIRNLKTSEMVAQVCQINDDLRLEDKRVSHVVVMGIGEPFDNYDNLLEFLRIINYPKGLEIGSRHITVSTCGLAPKIVEFANFNLQINLAISLHFASDNKRSKYMPINKAYDLKTLFDSLKIYYKITNRRITFEYIMLDGINDTIEDAYDLIKLIRGMNAYVNLIPMNETGLIFRRSKPENVKRFFDILSKNGVNVIMRKEMGHDIDAACGQLRVKTMKENKQWKD